MGVGTAFGLLLILTLVIQGLGYSIMFASRKVEERAKRVSDKAAQLARDKALAAVVGVSAAIAREDAQSVSRLKTDESGPL